MPPSRDPQRALHLTLLAALLLLASCGSPPAPQPTSTAADSLTPASPAGTVPPALTGTPEPFVLPTPVPLERPQYSLNVILDYAAKTVSVEESINYPNQTGESLPGVTLAVVPNLWPDCFTLESLTVGEYPVSNYTLTGQRLDVPLPQPLAPGGTLLLDIRYTLSLPYAAQADPNAERPRIFGYTGQQVNLTNWYPFVVPYDPGNGWVLHDPWFYGEHLVYEAADYDVTLRFAGLSSPPVVAASAPASQDGDALRYRLEAGRAFVFSLSPDFRVATAEADGVTVTSYYFPLFEVPGEAAAQVSAQAVQVFSQRFGPYPHASLSVVQGDFNDGMEYSGLFYLSRDFYNLYDATPNNYLVTVAAHETAHQWWFEKVGNDQALEPWLDEALCTYSERIFYADTSPNSLKDWWWPVRVDFYKPQGWLDISVYEGGGFRPYTDAVYLNGAHFLQDLHARIGDEAFYAFLKDYASQMAGMIATPDDFFHILGQHAGQDISDLIHTYFRDPH
ncbi:MAG: M1 family metallopeptidase [Chloroflexota bacterium]